MSDQDKPKDKDSKTLGLRVDHARLEPGQDSPTMQFAKTLKVGEAAAQAAKTLGYADQGTYTFSFKGDTLDRERPLVSYHLKDGDLVTLTDLGRAV